MRVFFFAVPYGSWQLEISGSASPMIPMMIFNIYIYIIFIMISLPRLVRLFSRNMWKMVVLNLSETRKF